MMLSLQHIWFIQGLDDVKSSAHLVLYVSSSEIMLGVKCCTTVRVLGEHIPPYGWDSWPGPGCALFGHSLAAWPATHFASWAS